jgi:hypothetical protein
MGKANPNQVNLREISSVKRPELLGKNKFKESDPYGLDKTMGAFGKPVDIEVRAKNTGMNVFTQNKPYQPPFDDVI